MDLKVQIPKRFKENLEARFNPKNAEYEKGRYYYAIKLPCPLCESYCDCFGCPFQKFKEKDAIGCFCWVNLLIPRGFHFTLDCEKIYWNERNHSLAVEQLNLLNERAKELIEWIEEKK